MDPFQALAFDPGGQTGWASFEYRGGNDFEFESGTLDYPHHHASIRSLIEYSNGTAEGDRSLPLTVISESFEFRQDQRRGLELASKEYIGIMKLICQDLCIPYIEQSPGNIEHYGKPNTAKGFMNYEKLRRLGQLHEPLEANRHRHDALQHLVYWLASKKRVEEIREKMKRES